MNAVLNIERIESGPAWMDAASTASDADTSTESELIDAFAKAAEAGDANALCPWAPLTTDWQAINRLPLEQRTFDDLKVPRRVQTLTELMVESLDYGHGPSMTEAMQLILNVATGCDKSTQAQARNLIERMGRAFATRNA